MSKKPKNWTSRLTQMALLIVAPIVLTGWHEVGGGGDPLRLLFSNAKQQAAVVVARMHPDAFGAHVPADAKNWLLQNKRELAADILKSPHSWIDSAETSCGHTAIGAVGGLIELSYPTCRLAIHSQKDALFTLIHESVHHFGFSDESFADAVAEAVTFAMDKGILDWQHIPSSPVVAGRSNHSAVWTGSQMIVFGGVDTSGQITNSGAIFDPATNQWSPLNTQGAPARAYHEAVWTGSKMIIWGGLDPTGGLASWADSGAIYDPSNGGQWTTFKGRRPAGALVPTRTSQTVVWTGTRMIVWGSAVQGSGRMVPEGGIFDPSNLANPWSDIKTSGFAPLRYAGHAAVWTGSQMIVWGGKPLPNGNGAARGETNEGAVWDSATNDWTPMRLEKAPTARNNHRAAWTGNRMLVFGGAENMTRGIKGTGGSYDPQANVWDKAIIAEMAPQRIDHSAVWTGTEMLIWGGRQQTSSFNLVSAISGDAQSMRAITAPSAPSPRSGHSAIWTGMSMIVFGGTLEDGRKAADGGLFYP